VFSSKFGFRELKKGKHFHEMPRRRNPHRSARDIPLSERRLVPNFHGPSYYPSYSGMIKKALSEEGGVVSYRAICRFMESNYKLPANYKKPLRDALKREVSADHIEQVGASYRLKNMKAVKKNVKKGGRKAKSLKEEEEDEEEDDEEEKEEEKEEEEEEKKAPKKGGRKIAPKKVPAPKKPRAVPRKKPLLFPAAVPLWGAAGGFGGRADEILDFPERSLKPSANFDSGVTEVVFSFDNTGSMSSALAQVRNNIKETAERLFKECPNIRIGLVAHGDYCDGPTRDHKGVRFHIATLDLTNDPKEVTQWITECVATNGGGDSDENYEQVLEEVQKFCWSPGSSRALVMIGDCAPHEPNEVENQMKTYGIPSPRKINWRDEADKLYEMGVKVYAVQCLNNVSNSYFYKALSARTCGSHVQLDTFKTVTEMIMAVCFREVSVERLATFEKEVEAAGRMNPEMRRMFRQVSGEVQTTVRAKKKAEEEKEGKKEDMEVEKKGEEKENEPMERV
jgi:hypothetical protein